MFKLRSNNINKFWKTYHSYERNVENASKDWNTFEESNGNWQETTKMNGFSNSIWLGNFSKLREKDEDSCKFLEYVDWKKEEISLSLSFSLTWIKQRFHKIRLTCQWVDNPSIPQKCHQKTLLNLSIYATGRRNERSFGGQWRNPNLPGKEATMNR